MIFKHKISFRLVILYSNELYFLSTGITEWNKYGVCGPNMPAIKIASELTFRADAVCVLGLLLVGRHRKEVSYFLI